MNDVIVDTSVWVAYFRGRKEDRMTAEALDYLLAGDEALVNDVILSELLPFMIVRGENRCADALSAVRSPALAIDWAGIRVLQETCLRNGINKVGIPDLIIAQQAMALGLPLFSLDGHFALMSKYCGLKLWPRNADTKRK